MLRNEFNQYELQITFWLVKCYKLFNKQEIIN